MNKIKTILLSFVTVMTASSALAQPSLTGMAYPYQNPNLSALTRAQDLLSRLTLEEKALLMLDESPAIPRLAQSQPASAKLQNVFKELALWIRKV